MNYAADGSAIGHRLVTCLRKKSFKNEKAAWSVIFTLRARGQDTERLIPYRCDFCREWHLGRTVTRMKVELVRAMGDW